MSSGENSVPIYESAQFGHISVLADEALELLALEPGKTYADVTVGLGGHLCEIVRRTTPASTIFGVDRDTRALSIAEDRLKKEGLWRDNIRLLHGNFADLPDLLSRAGCENIDGGILADLGVSSMQLDDGSRGFSFQTDAPLDMRMDLSAPRTAADLVNSLSEKELSDIIYIYGEEKASRLIARNIVAARPVNTTSELAAIVARSLRRSGRSPGRDKSHPATRTFQALRIAVNEELSSLEKFLRDSMQILSPGARIAVITFHSLEDRMVKQIFKDLASACICPPRQPICTCEKSAELKIITRKALQPTDKEVLANPRSRSAKLRAGERISGVADAGERPIR